MTIGKRWLLFGFLSLAAAAWGGTTRFWENFTQADLLNGSFSNVTLSPEGALSLAPASQMVYDTGQEYIFSMVRDREGILYVGTGGEGKVFKVNARGEGTLYFQTGGLSIFALALDSSDTLYVGTSPDGKVYRVRSPNEAVEFCNPGSKYIWALAFDAEDNLYLGTGSAGVVYKVDKFGARSVFYESKDSHVRCLLFRDNHLFLGTAPNGLVVRVDPGGKGFSLADIPLDEVHSLTADRFGTIYAAASSAKSLSPQVPARPAASTGSLDAAGSSAPVASVIETTVTVLASGASSASTESSSVAKETSSAKSSVYAIAPDRGMEVRYSSQEHMVLDAAAADDGSLYVATGPGGRLLKIDAVGRSTVVADSPEEDAFRLLIAGGSLYVGTSNRGKVYRLESRRAAAGWYESQVLDAGIVSSWGSVFWRATGSSGGSVELATRTGNTAKPDHSWSDWSSAYAIPGEAVSSPPGRYLQWRAAFRQDPRAVVSDPGPVLEQVRIAYLQKNMRPRVTELKVLPQGIALEKQPSLTSSGVLYTEESVRADGSSLNAPRVWGREQQPLPPRQMLQPATQAFTWKAEDDNGDELRYSLYFKREGDSEWRLLESALLDTFYTIQPAALPEGIYRLKVAADDEPSNPFDRFLVGERLSDPFVIAYAPPLIGIRSRSVTGGKVSVSFTAGVSTGAIASAEYSIDGSAWRLIYPVDGIADSSLEEYHLVTPELLSGEHLLAIRSSDRNGATGTASLPLAIP